LIRLSKDNIEDIFGGHMNMIILFQNE